VEETEGAIDRPGAKPGAAGGNGAIALSPRVDLRANLAAQLRSATSGLGLRLGLASTLAVTLVVGAGAIFAYQNERAHLLDSLNRAAATQGRLTLTGLNFAMLENNRTLLHELIEQYASSEEVERVYLTEATGVVAATSTPSWVGQTLPLPPTICPTCEPAGGEQQTQTSVVMVAGRPTLRSLTVVKNEPQCNRCHPPVQRTLGVLGVDSSMAPVDRLRSAIVVRTLVWGVAVALLVLLAEGAVVQFGALGRLRRLRDSTRSLLSARDVQRGAADEIGQLADGIAQVSTALHDARQLADRQSQFVVELIDQIEDGVAVFDRSLAVVAANRSYLRSLGATREQVDRRQLKCCGPSLCGEVEMAGCATRLAFRHRRLEKRIHKQVGEGREVYFEVFASPIHGATGEVEQVVEVRRDVTERVGLQAQMARSEQLAALGTLASGFSHEISTPLGTVSTSIQGMLRVLRDRERIEGTELASLRSRLETASQEVFRCRDITRSLLDLGRERRTARDQVQIGQVVTRMLEVIAPTAERQRVAVVNRCAGDLKPVFGRREQFEQVLLNLFINALEAMPRGGALHVEARSSPGGLELLVSDTGEGVAPGDAERIFEPFFSRKAAGTGLGLYLARQIIEAHGGRIQLGREGAGGAIFAVSLPTEPAQ